MTKAQKAAWIMTAAWLAFLILTACSPATSNSTFTPTPTACVTAAPASSGSGQSSSGAGAGQSNPSGGSAGMPTLSASELATRQASLEKANPGGPTTPVCPTPTPTPRP